MLLLGSIMAGCGPANTAAGPGASIGAGATPAPQKEYPFLEKEEEAAYQWGDVLAGQPFWLGNVMYNESVVFIKRDNGEITARLLQAPGRILSLKSYDLNTQYREGTDWELTEAGELRLLNTDIPYFTQEDLAGKGIKTWQEAPEGFDESGRARFGNAVYAVNEFIYEKQLCLTYTFQPGAWQGTVSQYAGDILPKTIQMLKEKKELRLVFFGDSNHVGCESSGYYNRAPYTPPYPKLVVKGLEEAYGAKVTLRNYAVGGTTSGWGLENLDRVIKAKPDLLVLGFGNNDLAGGGDAARVVENIKTMVSRVKAALPECEFILIGPILANANSGFIGANNLLPALTKPLQETGVLYIDIFATCADLLKTKDYIAISGNNINHPNDWLARVYAMNYLAALVDYKQAG